MKFLKALLVGILIFLGLLLLFLAISVGPVDRDPANKDPSYQTMMSRLDSLNLISKPRSAGVFKAGFSKLNITPSFFTSTAGYGNRKGKLFTSVHDSIYVRTIVIDNGAERVAIVSADLLIIPPTVTAALATRLNDIGFSLENTYLGATHTHNSIGNWGEGATRFIYGAYSDDVVNFLTDKIVSGIQKASANVIPAKLLSGKIAIPEAVENRLRDDGPVDPWLRFLEVHRSDSSKLLLMNYTAHATCLFSHNLEISRDYPGKLVDVMEAKGFDFAMFMAGAVGSHGQNAPEAGWECIDWMAETISTAFFETDKKLLPVSDSTLWMIRVPLALSDPQVKVTENLKVRSWLFRAGFGEYPAYLTALRIGDIAMIGTPCDFSGEFNPGLDSVASRHDLRLMITSFNGGYIGYLTPQQYYDRKHYETQLMNWYAPGTGEYITESIRRLLEIVSD